MWTDHPTSAAPFEPAYEDMCDEITWLEVTYEEKDAAKSHKARWCPEKRQWYAPPQVDRTPLRQWIKNRTYLNCGIEDRHVVRDHGAKWDAVVGQWFILEPGMTRALFSKWIHA